MKSKIYKTKQQYFCKEGCGNKIDFHTALYGLGRCKSCAQKKCSHEHLKGRFYFLEKNNLVEKKFGRLLVIKYQRKNNNTAWLCKCDCGNETIVNPKHLKSGAIKSCGCLRKETTIKNNKGNKYGLIHGLSYLKDYRTNLTLLKRYNITLEKYNELVKKQNNSCKICNKKVTKLCVDHNHETGRMRGLICYKCNTILGSYEQLLKNKELFIKMNNYLEEYK